MRSYLILSAINGLLLLLMMMLLGLLRTAVGLTAAVVTAAACEPTATCRGEEPTATCRGEGGGETERNWVTTRCVACFLGAGPRGKC